MLHFFISTTDLKKLIKCTLKIWRIGRQPIKGKYLLVIIVGTEKSLNYNFSLSGRQEVENVIIHTRTIERPTGGAWVDTGTACGSSGRETGIQR